MIEKKITEACKQVMRVAGDAYGETIHDVTDIDGDTLALFLRREIEAVAGHCEGGRQAFLLSLAAVEQAARQLDRVAHVLRSYAVNNLTKVWQGGAA